MTLREHLTQTVESWSKLGHPALLERFILRNGKEFTPCPRIGEAGEPKRCFSNAARHVMANPGHDYVEGYALRRSDPIMPIHHAWVTTNGTDAMDPTLDASDHEYIGFRFHKRTLVKELRRNGVYGLFDPGVGLNARLIFGLDPELKPIVEAVRMRVAAAFSQQEQTS